MAFLLSLIVYLVQLINFDLVPNIPDVAVQFPFVSEFSYNFFLNNLQVLKLLDYYFYLKKEHSCALA